MSRSALITASSIAHVVLVIGLGNIETTPTRAATAIEVFELPPEPEPETKESEPPPPEPPPPAPEPEAPRPQPRAPKVERAQPEPAQQEAAQPSALDALPDLGLSLGGPAVGGAGGGMAVRQGTGGKPVAPAVRKTLAPATRVEPKADACAEPASKPKVLELPRPAYTDEARALAIEGKVRIRITVDEHGNVVAAEVLEGLGHGLDDAALAAARSARFEPSLSCGKAVSSTFTLSIRFSAS